MKSVPEMREKRWRMILGGGQADGIQCPLVGDDKKIDAALEALYDGETNEKRSAGLGKSAPNVARWLGDIRQYFRTDVVRVLQKDAVERLNLQQLLMEPELLDAAEPDVNLVATILSLSRVIPARTKESARRVVQKVVDQLMKRLETPMRSAVTGALNRSARNNRPRHTEIDWNRTIRLNLRHWQREYNTIVPERLVGYGRKQRRTMRDIIICIDQSGSMAESVVYSSIFGAVMASLPAVKTNLVVFDTAVVDLTEKLDDPVEILFGVQLGGGTDNNGAVSYCQTLIRDPHNTIFVLISDLYEGGVETELIKKVAHLVGSGVQTIVLLALSDNGTPSYDASLAAKLASLGAPSFACTPEKFPDLMAAAITRQDIAQWAAQNDLVTTRQSSGS
jgi:hypothetical protein